MKVFDALESNLSKYLEPLSVKISSNSVLKAVAQGCLSTIPITIGISLVSIFINLPFAFLETSGIKALGQEATNVTLSMLPIYLISTVTYAYCKNKGVINILGPAIALGVFLVLMPSRIPISDTETVVALSLDYLGSRGIFLALIIGILVGNLYCKLLQSKLRIKLPDSVPPMVADSLSSALPSVIILTGAFIVKYLFSLSSFGNIFDAFNTIIQQPVMMFGTSPISFIFFGLFSNLLWFCGVHPAAINGIYTPIIVGAIVANTQAFISGSPLPYAELMIVFLICNLGGYGGTLGLCISLLFAKSQRYKATRNLFIVPNLFNINEPMVFGMPTVLNPLYLFPMLFSQFITGWVALGLYRLFQFDINPTYQLSFPWITPPLITAFAEGGILFFGIALIAILIQFVCYFPFFKIADAKEYALELRGESEFQDAQA